MPPRPTPRPPSGRRVAVAVAAVAISFPTACSRTIDEEDPPELIEHRIEPCRKLCEPFMSDECGAKPEDRGFRTLDECMVDCAAPGSGNFQWARQEDGTDACAEEGFAVADCVDALSCEEQRHLFTGIHLLEPDYPCKEVYHARTVCFDSTPSLDRTGD
jgi:hypothetical protein